MHLLLCWVQGRAPSIAHIYIYCTILVPQKNTCKIANTLKKSAPLSNSNLLVIGVTDKNKLMYSTVMICIHSINTYTVIHRDVLYRLLSLGIDNKAKTNLFSCYLVGFIDWW